jgi:hypothetical protein
MAKHTVTKESEVDEAVSEKIVQSFLPHLFTLSWPGGTVDLPSKKTAPKNIVFVPAGAFEYFTREKYEDGDKYAMSAKIFQEFIEDHQIRILDKVPSGYFNATERIAAEQERANEAVKATEAAKADNAALQAENEQLKAKILELGGEAK